MIKQTEDFCFLLTSSPFRQIILDLELEQISCHIQVQSNVGMVDAGDLEPCTEYLVMIRWTLTTFLVMLLVTLLLVILWWWYWFCSFRIFAVVHADWKYILKIYFQRSKMAEEEGLSSRTSKIRGRSVVFFFIHWFNLTVLRCARQLIVCSPILELLVPMAASPDSLLALFLCENFISTPQKSWEQSFPGNSELERLVVLELTWRTCQLSECRLDFSQRKWLS